ncbi:hypothetical protein [Azospirillum brasilense]|uniref:hypothetical protein n=1 Tax=Azospirillum brasilense TaxID=192 RepID=UPI00055283E7|nr:hypothetical protein [Azospirillum brasilense]
MLPPAFRQLLEIAPEIDAGGRRVERPQDAVVSVEVVEADFRKGVGVGPVVGQPEQRLPVPGGHLDGRPGAQAVEAQEGVLEHLVGEAPVAAERGHRDGGALIRPGIGRVGKDGGAHEQAPGSGPA